MLPSPKGTSKSMANYVRLAVIVAIIIGIVRGEESNELEDIDRNILKLNLPYGRRLDNELELVRLMLVAPRLCHPKRNSELINSLLGLPKNMHNAGKRK
ncbi:PDH protein, partial [Pseudoatta argentina]